MADLKELTSNPDFQGLPLPEKNKVMIRMFPDYAGLPAPERMKVLKSIYKGPGSGELQSMPEPPGFLSGFRESFGVPTLQEAKEFSTKAYEHPKETAKQVYSDFDQISKFAYDNPGKFLWAMTNMPMFKEAWDKHNYREALGILAGTGVQAATVVGEAGKIGKLQRSAFREGLTGKTAEALKSEDAAKVAKAVASQSEKLKLTLGERLASPKIEKVEQVIRGMPGVGGRFEKIEAQRQGLLFNFRDAMSDAVRQLQSKAQPIYTKLEENVPGFSNLQQQRRDAYQVGRSLMRQKKYPEARQAFIDANEFSSEIKKAVESYGDANTVAAWEHADKLWSQSQAKQAVVDVIRDNTSGFDQPRPLARVQPARPKLGSIIEDIKELDENGTLKRAIPNAQARDDFKTVADLYSRIQRKQSGYIAMRVLGYALLGTGVLGAHAGGGYLGELAGGYVLANMLAATGERAAGSLRLKNFLVAIDKGDLTRAETLAEGIAKSAQARKAAEETARAERQAIGDEQLRKFREESAQQAPPPEPENAPQVMPADNPPELDRYAVAQQELALTRHLNEAIRRLSATTKKGLNDQELRWIGEQTGVDMTQPGAVGKARKALIEKRNSLRIPVASNPKPTVKAPEPQQVITSPKSPKPPSTQAETVGESAYVSQRIGKMIEHGARNRTVRDMITYLEDTEKSPRLVMDEFWSRTFPTLSEAGRKKFIGQMKAQFGMKPGDILFTDSEGKVHRAESWKEIMDSGLQNDIASMEQPDQAIVGLAEILNEINRKAGKK